jgi:hypothetical protein
METDITWCGSLIWNYVIAFTTQAFPSLSFLALLRTSTLHQTCLPDRSQFTYPSACLLACKLACLLRDFVPPTLRGYPHIKARTNG